MKIHKQCIPSGAGLCTQCRGTKMRRVCPVYSALRKKDPVELYEYFVNDLDKLRKQIADLEETVQHLIRRMPTQLN
jgi:hypothetical protein